MILSITTGVSKRRRNELLSYILFAGADFFTICGKHKLKIKERNFDISTFKHEIGTSSMRMSTMLQFARSKNEKKYIIKKVRGTIIAVLEDIIYHINGYGIELFKDNVIKEIFKSFYSSIVGIGNIPGIMMFTFCAIQLTIVLRFELIPIERR